MTVRRLADESVQPPAFAFNAENARWAKRTINLYPEGRQQSAVIPLLMRAQDQEGWVSRAAIESVADMLSMPYIRVLEVATFYTQFQLSPVGSRGHIQVCGTTPCMLQGAEALIEICRNRIHPEQRVPNAAGTLSWEEVECLGACVNAPMALILHDTYEDLTPTRFEEILDAFEQGRGTSLPTGSQIGRMASAPDGGRVTLVEPPSRIREKFVPPTPPDAPAAQPAGAPPQAPVQASKPREVNEESAPAFKGPPNAQKVSEARAEEERKAFDKSANADGEPNDAMREGATGAESPASKVDAGKAPGKPTTGADRGSGAVSAGAAKSVRTRRPKANPKEVNPVAEKGGQISPEGGEKSE